VPAIWEATSEVTEIELGKATTIQLRFEIINNELDIRYESKYEFAPGSGLISPIVPGGFAPTTNYAPISPGVYSLKFVPDELGPQEIVFILRDSNGQELKEEIVFDVVQTVNVISIFLGDTDAIEIQLGDEVLPDVTFDPVNPTDDGYEIVSDDPDVVIIDDNNVCIGVGIGTANVTVTSNSNPEATDTMQVTVVAADIVPVTSIE